MIAKDVIKNKMIVVAGQNFIENEKVLDESQRTEKTYEKHIGVDKFKTDVLDKVLQNNGKQSENDNV